MSASDFPKFKSEHSYLHIWPTTFVNGLYWGNFTYGYWLPDTTSSILIASSTNFHQKVPKRWVPVSVSDGKFYQITEEVKHHHESDVVFHLQGNETSDTVHFGIDAFITPVSDKGVDDLDSGDTIPSPIKPSYDDFSNHVLQLNNDGTHFWRLARPGNPAASLGQFIAELREMPSIPRLKDAFRTLRGAGSEILNVQFGILPFWNDLVQVYNLQRRLSKKLEDISRNNGKTLHRKRGDKVSTDLYSESASWDLNHPDTWPGGIGPQDWLAGLISSPDYPYVPSLGLTADPWGGHGAPDGYGCTVKYRLTQTVERQFVGNFYYYIPDVGSDRWTRKATNALFGALPNASTLYSVIPWSWLIDWFSNVGDIISNACENAVENELVTDAYMMRTESFSAHADVTFDIPPYVNGGSGDPLVMNGGMAKASFELTRSMKLRQPATPYGFGIDYSSLSVKQIAILLALGFSRQRFL